MSTFPSVLSFHRIYTPQLYDNVLPEFGSSALLAAAQSALSKAPAPSEAANATGDLVNPAAVPQSAPTLDDKGTVSTGGRVLPTPGPSSRIHAGKLYQDEVPTFAAVPSEPNGATGRGTTSSSPARGAPPTRRTDVLSQEAHRARLAEVAAWIARANAQQRMKELTRSAAPGTLRR